MENVSMTANVSRELRERFVATLPEGKSVNAALRELIETVVAAPAGKLAPTVVAADPMPMDPETAAFLDATLIEPATHSRVPDPGCMHPRGTLYRSDHSVICGECGKVVR
jgi:hypothetical protein